MSMSDDVQLLGAIWILFDSRHEDLIEHPITFGAIPQDCQNAGKSLQQLLQCIESKGQSRNALEITLKNVREDWDKISAENKAKILTLAKSYKQIKKLPGLTPTQVALASVRWDLSDSLYAGVRKQAYEKLDKLGFDVNYGRFTKPNGHFLLMIEVPEVLASLLIARIEFDLAAISYSAPDFRRECEYRVKGRAEGTRQDWYVSIHSALGAMDPDYRPDSKIVFDKLNETLDPIISNIADRIATPERQSQFRELGAMNPDSDKEPPKEQTLLEKTNKWFQNSRVFVPVIVLAAVVAYVGSNAKTWIDLLSSQKKASQQLLIETPPEPVEVARGRLKTVVLTGKHLQGIRNRGSITTEDRSTVQITGLTFSEDANGREQLTFTLDASHAHAGSYKMTFDNGGSTKTLPYTILDK